MSQFLGNMGNAWAKGVEAWQAIAGVGSGGQGDHANAALGAMMAKSFEAFASRGPDNSAASEAGQAVLKQVVDLSPVMAKAYMVGVGSAMRYQSALAELVVQCGASLMQAATSQSPPSPADSRALADEMRAFVRGIGDAATREARRLEHDLAQVGESIAQATDQASPSPYPYQPRRRHEMKP